MSITPEEYRWAEALRMKETGRDGLQNRLRERATALGWEFYHTWNAKKSAPGFPDCMCLKGGRQVVIEAKQQDERKHQPSPDQIKWLNAFRRVEGCEVYLLRPLDELDGTTQHILAVGAMPERFWEIVEE